VSTPHRIPTYQPWPVFIYERTGDVDFDRALLGFARFSQQRLWERSGTLASLYTPEAFRARYPDPRPIGILVRFGRLDGGPEGLLYAGPETQEPSDSFAIRGSDAAAIRLAYTIEPFFRAVQPDGEFWTAP
jgi:hypothetical protein